LRSEVTTVVPWSPAASPVVDSAAAVGLHGRVAGEHQHDSERAPAPAPEVAAAPAVVANPLQGGGAGPAPSAISPPQALALQRSAGNRAVARLIARQGATAPPPPAGTAPGASASTAGGLTHGQFTAEGGEPTSKGTVMATPKGTDMVDVTAPDVDADGSVSWKKPADPGAAATPPPAAGGAPPAPPAGGAAPPAPAGPPAEARVGFLNTLLSGDRVYTYTEDGTPSGKVVREMHMMGPAGGRDAMFDTDKRTGKQVPHANSEAPFYGSARRIKPGDEKVQLDHFHDAPGSSVRRQIEGADHKQGKLAKISGADKFRLSIGVAEVGNASTIHLTAKEWTVPWDVPVDQKGGAGKPVGVSPFEGKLEDIKRGEGYVVGEAEEFPWPQTPDDVKSFPTQHLINAIPYAERLDVGSWMLMCQELRRRNPTCTITTNVAHSANSWIWDDVAITIAGPRTVTKNESEGLSAAKISFRLLEILDPQDLKSGLSVKISISIEGSSPQPMDWPWPFGALRTTRYWWDTGGAAKGEWKKPEKGFKEPDAPTDISVSVSGFS
jgi:hypothetical protein